MLQYYYKTVRDEEFQLIPQAKEGCWIHIEDATTDDLAALALLMGLDQTDLHDCLDKFEVPREMCIRDRHCGDAKELKKKAESLATLSPIDKASVIIFEAIIQLLQNRK